MKHMNFNTAISQMMIFINAVYKEDIFPKEYAEGFLKLLNPSCSTYYRRIVEYIIKPYINTIAYEKWPEYDESVKLLNDEIEIPVQINGKLKDNNY